MAWYNSHGGDDMANVQKYTRTEVGGGSLTRHYERAKDEHGNYHQWGNQEIDPTRSHLNYNLAPEREQGQTSFINERISEVKCHKREDVNIMCSWIITVPKGLDESEHKQFFKEAYDFLCKKYNEKNVISAYVHMDETTPHLHYAFVPVVVDRKKGHEKVSAKEALGWSEKGLQKFHHELSRHMEKVFGRDIGILNGATKEGNKEISELKRETLKSQVKDLEAKKEKLEKQIAGQEKKEATLRSKIKGLEGAWMTGVDLDAIQPKETLTGAIKGVAVEQITNLKKMAVEGLRIKAEYAQLWKGYERYKELYENALKNVPTWNEKAQQHQDKERLAQLEKAFAKLPEGTREQILPTKPKEHKVERDLER